MTLNAAIRRAIKEVKHMDPATLSESDRHLHRGLHNMIFGLRIHKPHNFETHIESRADYVTNAIDSLGDLWDQTESDRLCWSYRVFDRVASVWQRKAIEESAWLDSFDA